MTKTKRVQNLIQLLNENFNKYESPEYKITETSTRHGERTYTVYSLVAEHEDGEVYFGDEKEKIRDNGYALMGFLVNSIRNIIIEDKIINIVFDTNSIKIELIV